MNDMSGVVSTGPLGQFLVMYSIACSTAWFGCVKVAAPSVGDFYQHRDKYS